MTQRKSARSAAQAGDRFASRGFPLNAPDTEPWLRLRLFQKGQRSRRIGSAALESTSSQSPEGSSISSGWLGSI
jgi:hypothetical protein